MILAGGKMNTAYIGLTGLGWGLAVIFFILWKETHKAYIKREDVIKSLQRDLKKKC